MEPIKLFIVGDIGVGKTCTFISRFTGIFPLNVYVPTTFDNESIEVDVNERTVTVDLWDVQGNENYARIRTLGYPKTDIFLITYSAVCRTSFENVTTQWIPELKHHCPNTPYLLIANKIDLRTDPLVIRQLKEKKQSPITTAEGIALAKEIRAAGFVEYSALTQENLQLIFDTAMKVLFPPEQKNTDQGFLTKWAKKITYPFYF